MKFWLGLVWLLGLLMGIHEAGAQELRANFRRISLDISSTEVSHAEQYVNMSIRRTPSFRRTARMFLKECLTLCLKTSIRTGNGTTVCL